MISTDACHLCLSTGHLPRRGNQRLGSMRQDGKKGAAAEKVRGGFLKDKPKLREGVGDKEDLEEKFSIFFENWFQPGILVTQRMESADSIGMQK